MISSIAIVAIVAFVSYVIVPCSGYLWVRSGWKRMLRRFRKEPGITGICTGFADGKLLIHPTGTDTASDIRVSPRHTLFFILRKDEESEKLDWRTVFLLQTGTTLFYIPAKKRFVRCICIFYEEKNSAALAEQLRKLTIPERIANPVKPYSVAAGAFTEFLLFLLYTRNQETGLAGMLALAAIFGIALPYLPPGLFFTLTAHLSYTKKTGAKKSRQRRVAGFLLITAGTLLNIGIVFFVIRRIGL